MAERVKMDVAREIQFCKLIDKIECDYGLYIGVKSIASLSHFLDGYRFRCFEESNYLLSFQSEFQTFIEKKYHSTSVRSWKDIIKCNLPEDEAFDLFYRLYRQFLRETDYGRNVSNTGDGTMC